MKLRLIIVAFAVLTGVIEASGKKTSFLLTTYTDGIGDTLPLEYVIENCVGGDFFCANVYKDGEFIYSVNKPI